MGNLPIQALEQTGVNVLLEKILLLEDDVDCGLDRGFNQVEQWHRRDNDQRFHNRVASDMVSPVI